MSQPSGTWRVNQPWGSVSTGMAALLYDLAGTRAGEGAAADDRLAANEDVANADWILHGVFERRLIRDRVGIEHDHVRALAFHERAEPAQAERRRRLRGHL